MAPIGFGEWLRQKREARGLTLEGISDQTKIPLWHLEALERGAPVVLPAFYQRAEVRAFAKAVGADEGLALTRLQAVVGPVEEAPVKVAAVERKMWHEQPWQDMATQAPLLVGAAILRVWRERQWRYLANVLSVGGAVILAAAPAGEATAGDPARRGRREQPWQQLADHMEHWRPLAAYVPPVVGAVILMLALLGRQAPEPIVLREPQPTRPTTRSLDVTAADSRRVTPAAPTRSLPVALSSTATATSTTIAKPPPRKKRVRATKGKAGAQAGKRANRRAAPASSRRQAVRAAPVRPQSTRTEVVEGDRAPESVEASPSQP